MSSIFYSSPTAQLVERQASNRQIVCSSPTRNRILFYARLCTVIVHCVESAKYRITAAWSYKGFVILLQKVPFCQIKSSKQKRQKQGKTNSSSGLINRKQADGAIGEPSDKSDFSLLAWDSFSQEIRDLFTVVRSITSDYLYSIVKTLWIYLKCSHFLPKKEELCYFYREERKTEQK